ncbi:MAG: hypothetical protein GX335_09805 [Firmicutes bacterium]|nr:hypothetical protein [Bacillota bacterium]
MFVNKFKICFCLLLFLLPLTASAQTGDSQWRLIHGNVQQVLAAENKILLENEGERRILQLEADCLILRLGKEASLASLRPISGEDFQDVLCWVNPQGFVSFLLINYTILEEKGVLVNYDIFGNVK